MPTGKAISKRRVPDALRRRALTSCDRCKTRRVRCVRGGAENEPCKTCSDGGFTCETTLPRKKRLYGSVDSLSFRYKALESLVRGLFPSENVDDLQTILRIAADRQIDIPSQEDNELNNAIYIDGDVQVTPEAFFESRYDAPWPCNVDHRVQCTVNELAEETCIAAPHGISHYVGPASSFEFASAIRQLVAKRNRDLDSRDAAKSHRSRLLAEFAHLKTSIAMEPRIETHPASTVREDGVTIESRSAHMTPVQELHEEQRNSRSRSSSPYRQWLQRTLPARNICDTMVKAFFDKVHPNYLLFHRATFQTRYEFIWRRGSTNRHETEPGWLSCLFMVLVFGAQALENNGFDAETAKSLQRRFLKVVREGFQHLALTASLCNVQALLLLQLYEHNAGERNTSWILLGQAARMAIALGMHREGTSHHFEPIERNTRRAVWFTLYSFEQYAALQLGRPTTLKALEVNVALPDETMMDGNDYPPSYLEHASNLLNLSSKVRHFATAASLSCFNQTVLVSLSGSVTLLARELTAWKDNLPQYLKVESYFNSDKHRRAVLLLHINYNYLTSVLYRPYLLCRINCELQAQSTQIYNSSLSASHLVMSMSQECLQSSVTIAEIMQLLLKHSLLEGMAWTDFFYIFHSLLVMCLPSLVRRAENTHTASLDAKINENVQHLIHMCQNHQLAPTYQILSQVSIQFAHIVRLIGEDILSTNEVEQNSSGEILEMPSNSDPEAQTAQGDGLMPSAELYSSASQPQNHTLLWDFFNIAGHDDMNRPVDFDLAFLPTSFSSLPIWSDDWNSEQYKDLHIS